MLGRGIHSADVSRARGATNAPWYRRYPRQSPLTEPLLLCKVDVPPSSSNQSLARKRIANAGASAGDSSAKSPLSFLPSCIFLNDLSDSGLQVHMGLEKESASTIAAG